MRNFLQYFPFYIFALVVSLSTLYSGISFCLTINYCLVPHKPEPDYCYKNCCNSFTCDSRHLVSDNILSSQCCENKNETQCLCCKFISIDNDWLCPFLTTIGVLSVLALIIFILANIYSRHNEYELL